MSTKSRLSMISNSQDPSSRKTPSLSFCVVFDLGLANLADELSLHAG